MVEPSSSFPRDDGLSVVIPTLQAGEELALTLDCLYAGSDPLVREIVVADGGSTDDTTALAERRGARVISAPRGRGSQLAAGARAAECDWLLFLHADTRLGAGWREAVGAFTAAPENRERAGVFRFALDDAAPAARRLERIVGWRSRLFGLPYGDQGVLIHRSFYEAVGGFRPLPLMEDVDLVRRIGPLAADDFAGRGGDFGRAIPALGLRLAQPAQPDLPHALHPRRAAPADRVPLWLGRCPIISLCS